MRRSYFLLICCCAIACSVGAQSTQQCNPANNGVTNPACPASDPYCQIVGGGSTECTECNSGTDYVCDCTPGLMCNVTATSTLRGTCMPPPLLGAKCNSGADCITYYSIGSQQAVASQLECVSGHCVQCNWILDKGPYNCTYGSKSGQVYGCSASGSWYLVSGGSGAATSDGASEK